MEAGPINRVQIIAEHFSALLFGGAAGFAAYVALEPFVALPELAVLASAAAIVANLGCGVTLKALRERPPKFAVPVFDVREIDGWDAPEELLLFDEDRVAPATPSTELLLTDTDRVQVDDQALLLDDVLAELGPDSRVVRLFDRKAMPTPGQLKSRIDDHLGSGSASAMQSDAAQALSEALADLRRSLR